jgi:putative oxidoreductase
MEARNLGRALVFIGIAAVVLSMGWWAWYYNEVFRALGANPPLAHPMGCLLWTSDLCAKALSTTKLANLPAYSPFVLWVSIAVLLAGLGVVFMSASTQPYPETPATEPRPIISKLEPFYAWARDLSWPIIRIAVAGTLFVHGFGKMTAGTVSALASGSLARRGIEPSLPMAYVVYFNEGIGTILVALGLFTRFAAASIAIEMFVLTFVGHFANGFGWSSPRGGWEMPLVWGLIFFAIALRGGGPYSLDRVLRREL